MSTFNLFEALSSASIAYDPDAPVFSYIRPNGHLGFSIDLRDGVLSVSLGDGVTLDESAHQFLDMLTEIARLGGSGAVQ